MISIFRCNISTQNVLTNWSDIEKRMTKTKNHQWIVIHGETERPNNKQLCLLISFNWWYFDVNVKAIKSAIWIVCSKLKFARKQSVLRLHMSVSINGHQSISSISQHRTADSLFKSWLQCIEYWVFSPSASSDFLFHFDICSNGTIFFLKICVWLYTGSHSMFAESIHSVADTVNQIILAFGLHKSAKVSKRMRIICLNEFFFFLSLCSKLSGQR